MRTCPKCSENSLLEDGYCGNCRESIAPPDYRDMPLTHTMAAVGSELRHQRIKYPLQQHSLSGWILIMRKCLNKAEHEWVGGEENADAILSEIRQVVATGLTALDHYGVPWRLSKKPDASKDTVKP